MQLSPRGNAQRRRAPAHSAGGSCTRYQEGTWCGSSRSGPRGSLRIEASLRLVLLTPWWGPLMLLLLLLPLLLLLTPVTFAPRRGSLPQRYRLCLVAKGLFCLRIPVLHVGGGPRAEACRSFALMTASSPLQHSTSRHCTNHSLHELRPPSWGHITCSSACASMDRLAGAQSSLPSRPTWMHSSSTSHAGSAASTRDQQIGVPGMLRG